MADEIQRSQFIAGDFPPTTAPHSRTSDEASADNELQNPDVSIITLQEPVEEPEAQQQQIEELSTKGPVESNQRCDNPSLGELGQGPLPPRRCMLCGGIEFSETSVFCTECGAPLKL